MWPTALQLTRDECRGILRRLELESYANVISVFRAQGGLTDSKSKLLEDLRNVFHISQERHRAEARRVANDEQLSTIAEAISGPNTYQEWSREGRRPYPLLPRVPPQTALCVVANHVAAEVTNENTQLPYPSETGNLLQPKKEFINELNNESAVPVVISDPYQPEIPDIRKTLKRNLPPETPSSTKKRIISDMSPNSTTGELPLNTTTQIRKLYNSHSKTQSKAKNTPGKKSNTSPIKRPTAASAKKRLISGELVESSPNKANNANSTIHQSQLQTQMSPAKVQSTSSNVCNPVSTVTSLEVINPPPPPSQLPTPSMSSSTSSDISNELQTAQSTTITPTTPIPLTPSTITIPQIATSKKDISKNLSKLNMISNHPVPLQQQQQQHPQQLSEKIIPECKTDKLSTPVQKYIVDNRMPPMQSTQYLDKQQVITTKLKPMTTILPTPLSSSSKAKVTSVKTIKAADILCSTPVSSQPQVFNIIDANTPTTYLPHTPPAIINISSKFEPEHGKVLKTKLLPLMLSSGSKVVEPNSTLQSPIKSSPSSAGTVFRKPSIIKTNMPPTTIKQKFHITNQQIISPPTVASLKMSPHLHLKGVAGGGPIHNRNSVKIFSSPNGKMFIQSADGASTKQMTKVNTIVPTQKGIVSTNAPPGRIAIQKVHIIPAPGAAAVATSSATALGNVTIPKPMTISKPNMIIMPMTGQQTMKSLPIVKNNKFSSVLPTAQINVQDAGNSKSNVIVIGSVPTMPQTMLPKEIHGFSNRNSMITEDTPVDIITTPMIVDVDSIGGGSSKIQTKSKLQKQTIKPTETIDLTTTTDTQSNSTSQQQSSSNKTIALVSNRPISEKSFVKSSSSSGEKSENETSSNKQQQQQKQQQQPDSMVIGATDWEMELDQEVGKTKAIDAEKMRNKRRSVDDDEGMIIGVGVGVGGGVDEEVVSLDEHFVEDDVIEEHDETEEEMEISVGTDQGDKKQQQQQQLQQRQSESEINEKKRHEFEEDEEDETIEVGDEQMKTSESDVIQYDESYESVNDELDENITIEYVDDEPDGYEEKINSTSSDEKDITENNSNTINIHSTIDIPATPAAAAAAAPIAVDQISESSENKSQINDCMVSVEEISSTTQQQSISSSKSDH